MYRNKAKVTLAELDRHIVAAPLFSSLRHFSEGQGFKQWTGDDSKALMKVFLPAITGLVPNGMVRAVAAFLEFCYLICCSEISEDALKWIEKVLITFQKELLAIMFF
ncbi:hypothetical protein NP233_g3926 [Leucocoprinus birnbaumii]|uniref:Uncharacterized protein n=1 Tax=Leucocoprinus birnbaumii TaxID=56174 RepID=A0AAD5VX38_9AGAR|nr:hypothetical protein NP233_g3926 [Leucocoprinus birnbaumii]